MVRFVVLQVVTRFLALHIGARTYIKRRLACVELRLQTPVHVKLAYLVTHHAYLALYVVMDIRAAVFVYCAAYECVVGPFVVIDAVVRHAVTHKPLTFVHRKGGDAELQLRVIGFAECDG